MKPIIYLEWSYTPMNYFEESLHEKKEGYSLEIVAGRIKAILDESDYDKKTDFFDKIQEEIENYFIAIQIVTHNKYSLSKYNLCKEYPNGRKDVTIFPEPIRLRSIIGSADFKITKADGTTVYDSKKERLDEEKLLAELLIKFKNKDRAVQKITKSYDSAVSDPANELIHLYEIRDSLNERFGSEKQAKKSLAIPMAEWKEFGKLANDEPIREGRHRGKKDSLRKATHSELTMARNFVKKMIFEYLKLLENEAIKPIV